MSEAASHSSHDDHGHHGSPFIQHHFNDAEHQFDSGKFGIWLFLVQEILFFSALFVAYIVYRTQHPEIFLYGSHYLDTTMGAINTGVLILSSFTAAMAVRCAQLGQKKALIGCLLITLLCAFGFLGIKYVEYSHKIHTGTLFGASFNPCTTPEGALLRPDEPECVKEAMALSGVADASEVRMATEAEKPPANTNMFFTIYFAMTGLHGIHVLAGIIVFFWLLFRAVKGHFTPDYYGPVDFAALYWHLVDLIWIFLFPLFYLID
ncbi:cytochrome c oxidase subunit 3 family protein [Haliangium ochraceum]|uniref:Cytochrome c oxidase subunit III n=1 Tax=Haliangium ochraceum (strain DSM 14365 / JCM 11303 / SMP-2) TaxID=502025 RepID=D0LJB1_HALO1|nr:cytochrome c oxidase subunit 3 family protein [Haliangium ochraceum]ACY14958.1 cytochrome c oxidase subunit III [Haliangium ochraceum DSM 14365]